MSCHYHLHQIFDGGIKMVNFKIGWSIPQNNKNRENKTVIKPKI